MTQTETDPAIHAETLAALVDLLAAVRDLNERHPDHIAARNRAQRAIDEANRN